VHALAVVGLALYQRRLPGLPPRTARRTPRGGTVNAGDHAALIVGAAALAFVALVLLELWGVLA
jgi:hypothetical protein